MCDAMLSHGRFLMRKDMQVTAWLRTAKQYEALRLVVRKI